MKKALALVLSAVMVLSLAACSKDNTSVSNSTETSVSTSTETSVSTSTETSTEVSTSTSAETTPEKSEGVMTYAEYAAAAVDDEVVVEFYVQDTQSWWKDQIVVYGADKDGGYLAYNMACSQEDAAKLVPGTKIRVKGFKAEWAGEVEIAAGATFEFVEGDSYVATAVDLTDKLGTDELIASQNKLVKFTDLVIESVSYKNDEPGDDIYVTASKDGKNYDFCLEYYLNGSNADFYNLVGSLKAGDIVDLEGYLYWYYGMNPHLTVVTVKGNVNAKSEGVMTYADYDAAAIDDEVTVEFYVQATQSWWKDQIVVYGADKDGGYLAYNMACSQEDAAKLVPGTKIRVKGFKAAWAGEVEIAAGATFEFVEGDSYIATAVDLTDKLGTDELIASQNKLAKFTDLVIESVTYKNDQPGDDIYVNVSKDGATYSFCLEYYLNGSDEAFYNKVGALKAGDVVDIEGFLYWYNGVNTHITSVVVK